MLPADKGNVIAIMNTAKYDIKVWDVLERATYRTLAKDLTHYTQNRKQRKDSAIQKKIK